MTIKDTKGEHLRGADEFKAMKLIEQNGKVVDGCYYYNPGWSDYKIAQEIGCKENQISRRRADVFGPLRRAGRGAEHDASEIEKRIETLEVASRTHRVTNYELSKRVEHLEKAINIMLTAPNRDAIPKDRLDALKLHFNGLAKTTAAVE